MRGHVAEPGGRAEDDRVIVGKLVHRRDRRRLIDLEVGFLRYVFRHQLGHPLDRHVGAGTLRAFGDRLGHCFDMSVCAVVEHEDLGHWVRSVSGGLGWLKVSTGNADTCSEPWI